MGSKIISPTDEIKKNQTKENIVKLAVQLNQNLKDIQAYDENLKQAEKIKNADYCLFWTMKSQYSILSDKNNPLYEARKNAMSSEEKQITPEVVRQLAAQINDAEKELRDDPLEMLIKETKQDIKSKKENFIKDWMFFKWRLNMYRKEYNSKLPPTSRQPRPSLSITQNQF